MDEEHVLFAEEGSGEWVIPAGQHRLQHIKQDTIVNQRQPVPGFMSPLSQRQAPLLSRVVLQVYNRGFSDRKTRSESGYTILFRKI